MRFRQGQIGQRVMFGLNSYLRGHPSNIRVDISNVGTLVENSDFDRDDRVAYALGPSILE